MALFIHCGSLLWTRESPGMEVSFIWSLATSLSPIISGSHSSFHMPLSRITKVVELLTWNRYNRFLTLSPIPLHRLPPGMLKYRSEYVPSMIEVLPTFSWNLSALERVPPLSLSLRQLCPLSSSPFHWGHQGLAQATGIFSKKPDCTLKSGLVAPLVTHHSNLSI